MNGSPSQVKQPESTQYSGLHGIYRRISLFTARRIRHRHVPEMAVIMAMAVVVGVATGFGTIIFEGAIERAQELFFGVGSTVFAFLGSYFYLSIIPAIGGLIDGPLIYYVAREARGHGVPEVMQAIALQGGRMRPRVAVIKIVAAAVCIGSGGSVGGEGPIVQIGGTIGSSVGQFLRLSSERIRNLVACGAAGGIAAIFNAPIAGAMFALEIILGDFHVSYFGSIVMSAVMADVVATSLRGPERSFQLPNYQFNDLNELLVFAGLGIAAALFSVIYRRMLAWTEEFFDRWKRLPRPWQPAIGGLLVGIIGVALVLAVTGLGGPVNEVTFNFEEQTIPAVFGNGYDSVALALLGRISLLGAALLLGIKLFTTGITLGSGGSGGTFAPALFLGAMLGVVYGHLVHFFWPVGPSAIGAYALVGMAAMLAGSAQAPATAILLIFEITGNYNLILPVMLATVLSMIISGSIERESMYTLELIRQGVRLQQKRDIDLLEGITVGEAMSPTYDSVSVDLPLTQLMRKFEESHHHGYIVLDEQGLLAGVVTITDLDHVLKDKINGKTVRDIVTEAGVLVAYPNERLSTAMLRMGLRGVGRLPVVLPENPKKVIGVLRRHNIIHAYNAVMAKRVNIAHRLKTLEDQADADVQVVELDVTSEMACAGKTLRDLAADLPDNCIVTSIHRKDVTLIPHGDTVIQPGDHLVLLAGINDTSAVRETLS